MRKAHTAHLSGEVGKSGQLFDSEEEETKFGKQNQARHCTRTAQTSRQADPSVEGISDSGVILFRRRDQELL